jgi:nicotinamidase-related amidase
MKPALLVIDIQNIWLDDNADLKRSVEKRIDVINGAIAWFRRHELPVIVVYHEEKERGLLPGTKPFEVPGYIRVEESDVKVNKRYPSAFGGTGLASILKREGCDTVVIAGLSASGCVLASYFGAWDHDLHPYLVEGGVASHKEEHVRAAEDICETVSLQAFDKTLL